MTGWWMNSCLSRWAADGWRCYWTQVHITEAAENQGNSGYGEKSARWQCEQLCTISDVLRGIGRVCANKTARTVSRLYF